VREGLNLEHKYMAVENLKITLYATLQNIFLIFVTNYLLQGQTTPYPEMHR